MKKQVCFVCTANICRSPFAEFFFRKRIEEFKLDNYESSSCGLFAQTGQSSPSSILETAKEFEVDLSTHLSKPMSEELANDCAIIFGMERSHCQELETQYPETKGRVFLMRNFALEGPKTRDVTDPFGLSLDFIRTCYDDIAESIDGFVAQIRKEAT